MPFWVEHRDGLIIGKGNQVGFKTAPMSSAIKVITGLVIIGAMLFFGFSSMRIELLIPGGILLLAVAGCYLTAPKEYVVENGELCVRSVFKTKNIGKIQSAIAVTEKPPFTIKVWANGGLFGGVGLFRNKLWGVFRAYVTSARHEDMVMVRTDKYKIVVITPENPAEFIKQSALAS